MVYGAIDWIRACVDFGTTAPARRKGCGALGLGFLHTTSNVATKKQMYGNTECFGVLVVCGVMWCYALVF